MKGFIDPNVWILIGAMIICGLLVLALMSLKFSSVKRITEDVTLEEDKYTMVYAMNAANLYAKTSLNYAVYQACYDTLRNSEVGSEEQFESALGNAVKNNLNTYLSDYRFLEAYVVKFPSQDMKIKIEPDKIELNLDGNLVMEKTRVVEKVMKEEIKLEGGASLEVVVEIPCLDTYQIGVREEDGVAKDLKIELINAKLAAGLEDTFSADVGSDIDCDAVFESAFGTKKHAKDTLRAELESRIEKLSTGTIALELKDLSLIIKNAGGHTSDDETICDFNYEIKADILMTVDVSDEKTYPVWNGNAIAFERLIYQTLLVIIYP
ncbi:MAG: hypothetical protein ISS36_01525 [Candidatus Aenigmarchaeota archaeon]|nr:hypothetical protein [Candidatus Aenigmarchaeota archaeon]